MLLIFYKNEHLGKGFQLSLNVKIRNTFAYNGRQFHT